MGAISDFLSNPSVRRAAAAGLSAAVLALNKKLGLDLDPAEISGLVAIVLGYLVQSAAVDRARIIADAQAAGDAAAAKVDGVSAAAAALAPPEAKP